MFYSCKIKIWQVSETYDEHDKSILPGLYKDFLLSLRSTYLWPLGGTAASCKPDTDIVLSPLMLSRATGCQTVQPGVHFPFSSVLVSTHSWENYLVLELLNSPPCSPAGDWLCLSAVCCCTDRVYLCFVTMNSCMCCWSQHWWERWNETLKLFGRKSKEWA